MSDWLLIIVGFIVIVQVWAIFSLVWHLAKNIAERFIGGRKG